MYSSCSKIIIPIFPPSPIVTFARPTRPSLGVHFLIWSSHYPFPSYFLKNRTFKRSCQSHACNKNESNKKYANNHPHLLAFILCPFVPIF